MAVLPASARRAWCVPWRTGEHKERLGTSLVFAQSSQREIFVQSGGSSLRIPHTRVIVPPSASASKYFGRYKATPKHADLSLDKRITSFEHLATEGVRPDMVSMTSPRTGISARLHKVCQKWLQRDARGSTAVYSSRTCFFLCAG